MGQFDCNICQKEFTKNSNLNRHIKDQHDTKYFNCVKCGTRIKNNNNFRKHKQICNIRKIITNNAEVQTEPQHKSVATQTEDIFIFASKEDILKYCNQGIFLICAKCFLFFPQLKQKKISSNN